ncbi:MAG: DegT/DnrJ/EryC1/StrS family aminotransferase [Fibrobacteria bacterium]
MSAENPDFIVFGLPRIEQDEIDNVVDSLNTGWLGTGPKVKAFEDIIKNYKGSNHAVALNSCTAALHLSILCAGLKPGDEVITTPMTFCATVNAIIHAGATPVLADIDPVTLNIDPKSIQAKITPRTRALLPVHFAGRACDMDAIMALAKKHDLKVIEDCAHAIESTWKGKHCGTFGDFGCFSFYVTKNIVTGEGGMVITDNEENANRLKVLGLHGMSKDAWKRFSDSGYKHYQVIECGFKYNMMDIQAAIGIKQMDKIEKYWVSRQEAWSYYNSEFAGLPITLPAEPDAGSRHAYHLYTIQIDEKKCGITRDAFLDRMTANKIGVGVHYLSVPEHPYYQKTFGWKPEDYPHAMRVGRQIVSLPISARLTGEELSRVVKSVKSILS